MTTGRKILCAALALVIVAGCAFLLFLPLPKAVEGVDEHYLCAWENGKETRESFATACSALAGVEEGGIVLTRNGISGKIEAGEELNRVLKILQSGSLAELLALEIGEMNRLEKAALYRTYGNCGWYVGEFFAYDGVRVFRTDREIFDKVVLLSGDLPKGLLRDMGAKTLVIAESAELTAKGLVGSKITEVEARVPYYVKDGAIYLQTAGGRRLIAGLPHVKSLAIDCDFIDEGALAPCTQLEKLTLPAWFNGTLRQLFGESPIPEYLIYS